MSFSFRDIEIETPTRTGSPAASSGAAPRSDIYYWKSDRPGAFQRAASERPQRPGLPKLLLGELQRTFPGTEITLEPAHGQGNHITFFAITPEWRGFVRVEDGPERDDFMDVESSIIETVRGIGIPAPKVYAVDSSRKRVPFAWQVLQLISDPDLNQVEKSGKLDILKVAKEIGRYVASWQSIRTCGFGPFNPEIFRSSRQLAGHHSDYPSYFLLRLRRHLAFLLDHGFLDSEKAEEIIATITHHRHHLELTEGCLVHKDLALWNILGTPQHISAFIDWEDAISGDPLDDLSLVGCFHPGEVVTQALQGYQELRTLPDNHRARFWLHLLRNMLVKAVVRLGSGFFERSDELFLINAGATGKDLSSFTRERIHAALSGLTGNKEVADL